MHFLPDDDDEEEEDADDDEAVLNLMRMAMVRSKREVNRYIFSHSWRRFWKKKDLLANRLESNIVPTCSWEDIIHLF